jgi:probable F420-dependent oxidoreductase
MKIGVPLFRIRPEQAQAVARRAEALGFESVWVPEHVVFPPRFESRYPYAADGIPPITPESPLLDPLLLLTHVAAATSTIRLGTNIYLVPLRHPLLTARTAVTLDVLSGGRLTLGVGVGWLEGEFEAMGVDFRTRGARCREYVRALRTLWTEPEPEFHGRYVSFGPVKFEPKPIQKPSIPILLGGETDAALARAAAVGDGWYGAGHTPETARTQVQKLRALLDQAGRAAVPFEITASHKPPTLTRDDVRRYADAGVQRIAVVPWQRGREAEEALGRVADEVLGMI